MAGSFKLSDFKKGNLFFTLIIAGFLLFVIFFSEWFSFKPKQAELEFPGFYEKDSQDEAINENTDFTDIEAELEGLPPLEQVNHLIDNGYIDHIANVDKDGNLKKSFSKKNITWNELRGNKSKRYLKQVSSSSAKIAKSLANNYPKTKDALYNLSGNINSVLKQKDKTREANEVVDYLQKLDLIVTNTMVQERVPRNTFIEWSKVSLGPVLGNAKGDKLKNNLKSKFNPQLTLTSVQIYRSGGGMGKYSKHTKVFARIEARVRGSEIRKMSMYGNDLFVDSLHTYKKKRDSEYIYLFHKDIPGYTPISIKVYDKYGDTYTKRYIFRPVQNSAYWKKDKQINTFFYQIPRRSSPRWLDAVYSYGRYKPGFVGKNFFSKPAGKKLFTRF